VTINECKKHFRSPWRKTEALEEHIHTAAGQTEPLHSELYDAVMALPQKYRVPLFLYYYEDFSTQEIASMLGIPRATVCTRLKRGRESLKTFLQEADEYE